MIINNLFPTPLAICDYDNHHKIKDKLIDHCLKLQSQKNKGGDNWISKSNYNTCGTYNIIQDDNFKNLNDWIYDQAVLFKNKLGQSKELKESAAWFNIYTYKNFQEYHNHNFNYISAIYYLKIKDNDAKTIFKSPLIDNINNPTFNKDNLYTWSRFEVDPVEGRLILFKSDLEHCVECQDSNNIRITLAYNYKI